MKSSEGKIGRDVWLVAVVVVLGAIGSILATTSINVAFETLDDGADTDVDTVQWIATGLPARARGVDLHDRVAGAPRRRAAGVPRLAGRVRGGVGAVRGGARRSSG